MSGTVAVRGETGEGGGGSGCLSRLDSDRCGHFRRLFLDSVCMCEKARTGGISLCVRAPASALYSDCSPQSKSIYSQANSGGRESKQTHCLIMFGSLCVFAGGRLILWVFPSLWRGRRTLMRRFRRSPGGMFQWESDRNMKVTQACMHRGGHSKCYR